MQVAGRTLWVWECASPEGEWGWGSAGKGLAAPQFDNIIQHSSVESLFLTKLVFPYLLFGSFFCMSPSILVHNVMIFMRCITLPLSLWPLCLSLTQPHELSIWAREILWPPRTEASNRRGDTWCLHRHGHSRPLVSYRRQVQIRFTDHQIHSSKMSLREVGSSLVIPLDSWWD